VVSFPGWLITVRIPYIIELLKIVAKLGFLIFFLKITILAM